MNLRTSAFAMVAFLAASVAAHAAPKWPLPEGIKSVEVNGYEIAYQEQGSGPPMVLVHGALSDYRAWAPVAPEMAKRFRVIAVSLRHFYPEKWDGKGSDFSFEQHADDVTAFIKALNLGKVHLIGHSRGGGVVVNVAKRNPEVIKTLSLLDATGFETLLPETPEGQKLASASRERIALLQKQLASGDTELAAQTFVDSLNVPGTWAKRTAAQKQRFYDNMVTAAVMSPTPPTSCAQVAKFDFPILLVHGENSPKNFSAMSDAMRKCRAVAEPIVIPGAAHNMYVDNPAVFNAALLGFLSRDLVN